MFKMRFLRSSECSKTAWGSPGQSVELTQKLATGKVAPHWYPYVVTNVDHYYAEIIEGL